MNLAEDIERRVLESHRDTHRLATVVANDTNQIQVSWNTPGGASVTKTFPKLSGVVVAAADVVLMVDATGQGGWIVLGKVIHN